MNKIFILLIILQFSNALKAQDKKILVQYEAKKGNITNTETLIARNNEALYVVDSLLIVNENNANITDIDEANNKITISQKRIKLDATKYYIKLNTNILFYTQQFKNKPVLVKDSIAAYEWNLNYSETKKINEFVCKKATTTFRGSQIVAWYTESISIPFGPWKFKGLPGLILEVYNVNDTAIHYWVATKVKYPYTEAVNFTAPKNLKVISYKDVVADMENQIKEDIARMQARVPKGVTATETKINRTGVEKVYEWEK